MVYDPSIPIGTDLVSSDISAMQTNFFQANTIIGMDHYPFDDNTVASRGLHKKISFTQASTLPAPIGSACTIYPFNDVNDSTGIPQAYFINSAVTSQLTNAYLTSAQAGTIMLPGGIFFMWGREFAVNDNALFQFNAIPNYIYVGQTYGFPNNCFNVQFTLETNDTTAKTVTVKDGTLTKKQVSIKSSVTGSITSVFWWAVGN